MWRSEMTAGTKLSVLTLSDGLTELSLDEWDALAAGQTDYAITGVALHRPERS